MSGSSKVNANYFKSIFLTVLFILFSSSVLGATQALSSAKEITAYSLNGTTGVIEANNNISVMMPFGTKVNSLIATFTTSGANVRRNGVLQVSGKTVNNFTNPLSFVVTAANGSNSVYTVTVLVAKNSAKAITKFSLNGTAGVIDGQNISILMPAGTKPTSLKATFTTSGASVAIGNVVQVSGKNSNDFTNVVNYVVTAADGSTSTYKVNVTVAKSSAKAITKFSLNGTAGSSSGKNISVVMPFGTDITALTATFTTTGASVVVGSVSQVSGQTPNDYTKSVVYVVTAEDGSSSNYTVTVTVAKSSAKVITKFALNGKYGNITGNNISVALPYGTDISALIAEFTTSGESVTVGSVSQVSAQTPNNFTSPISYVVTAANGSTRTYSVNVTVGSSPAKEIQSFSLSGTAGIITGQNISVVMPFGTDVTALTAKFTTSGVRVAVGSALQVSEQTPNNFYAPLDYVVTAADGSTSTYTVSVTVAPSIAKEMQSFSLNGTLGTMIGQNISVVMPFGTDITALTAKFTTSGGRVAVGGISQVSEQTSNNFSVPLDYVVTAADGSTSTYTVSATVAPSPAKAITGFSLNGIAGIITGQSISVVMPFSTNITALTATFTTSGASVAIGSALQTSTQTSNDFSSSIDYRVTAADGSTSTYTVNVTVAPSPAKEIQSFSLNGVLGTMIGQNISVVLPFGTDITALIATFTTNGASVAVGSALQTSTQTLNDFSSPIDYVVTAADGSTSTYTVNVTVAPSPAKEVQSFSLNGTAGPITGKNILVEMPSVTVITALIATFTTSGASVAVGSAPQVSGQTSNNYTKPLVYVVTAADGSISSYFVTAIVAKNSAKEITSFSYTIDAPVSDSLCKLRGTYTGIIGGQITEQVPNSGVMTGVDISVVVPFDYSFYKCTYSAKRNYTINGASVTFGKVPTPVSGQNQIIIPYTVKAADGSTRVYLVRVSNAQSAAKEITAFSLSGVSGVIDSQNNIPLSLPFGKDITALTATFTMTGAGVTVGGVPQVSGTTLNDYGSPINYVVTAVDGSTSTYTVNVTLTAAP